MKYTKFEDWMIGKTVKDVSGYGGPNDVGIVVCAYQGNPEELDIIWQTGNDKDKQLWLKISEVEFLFGKIEESFEEITINGKRYKLTQIED